MFAGKGIAMSNIPQTKGALSQHVRRAVYETRHCGSRVRKPIDHEFAFTRRMGSSWCREMDSCLASSPKASKVFAMQLHYINIKNTIIAKDVKDCIAAMFITWPPSIWCDDSYSLTISGNVWPQQHIIMAHLVCCQYHDDFPFNILDCLQGDLTMTYFFL